MYNVLGTVFRSLGPSTANDRSPKATSRDRRMTSSEEVDSLYINIASFKVCCFSIRPATVLCFAVYVRLPGGSYHAADGAGGGV